MPDPRPPVLRDKMARPEWYDNLDAGIRFPVKVLHAYGFDTCQSCEGGAAHSYQEPTVDLMASARELPAFAALHYLEAYGLDVASIAQVWNIDQGRIHEVVWRVVLCRAWPERADDWPNFVWGYRAQEEHDA
jgi:hypothetical protein